MRHRRREGDVKKEKTRHRDKTASLGRRNVYRITKWT